MKKMRELIIYFAALTALTTWAYANLEEAATYRVLKKAAQESLSSFN